MTDELVLAMQESTTRTFLTNVSRYFDPIDQDMFNHFCEAAWPFIWFGPRRILDATTNWPAFRQIIPYITLRYINPESNKVFYLVFKRSLKAGEIRLRNLWSIGYGGHINIDDAKLTEDGNINLKDTIYRGIMREMQEELSLKIDFKRLSAYGVLHFPVKRCHSVDSVHLGISFIYTITQEEKDFLDNLNADDETASEQHWVNENDFDSFIEHNGEWEGWTQRVVEHFKAGLEHSDPSPDPEDE